MEKCKHYYKTREELEKLHTKQLLRLRIQRIDYPSGICDYGSCPYWKGCLQEYDNYHALIKEILATRPHIPNKQESKAIRKANIKKVR